MAWNLHWQCCFQSLEGTQYAVNIYERSYSGNVVQLTGADEPFVTREDDDNDAFTPIRTQTGYLRIYDDDGTLLETLIPKNNTEKLVKVVAGEYAGVWPSGTFIEDYSTEPHTKWQGFVCAQIFTQPWESKIILEIPVKSMLAALADVTIDTTGENPIRNVAKMFVNAFSALDCYPSTVIVGTDIYNQFDDLLGINLYTNPCVDKQEVVNQTFVSYEYVGMNYYDILSSLCLLFGMVLRENGDMLYAVQYDTSNGYVSGDKMSYADFVAVSNGQVVAPSQRYVQSANLLSSVAFNGADNSVNFIPGGRLVEVNLPLNYKGDSFGAPPVTQDGSALLEYATYHGTFYFQPHPFVPNSNVGVGYYGYQLNVYSFESNYTDMVQQYSLINGYTATPYAHDVPLVTGAYPIRFYHKDSDSVDPIKLSDGIYIQTQYPYTTSLTFYNNYCLTLSSGMMMYMQNGYLDISFNIKHFIWNTTLARVMYGEENQTYATNIPDEAFLRVAVSVGSKFWDATNSVWVDSNAIDTNFGVHTKGDAIVSNKTSDMDVDSTEGYFIPVTNMVGVVRLYILNKIEVATRTGQGYTSTEPSYAHVMYNLKVAYLPNRTFVETTRESNTYLQKLSGFSDNKKIELLYGTINNNVASPSLIMKGTSYVELLKYRTPLFGQTDERPELHLLGRMASYYSEVRRALTAIIHTGVDMMYHIYYYQGKKFFGVKSMVSWKDEREKVKFIEVR